MSPFVLAELDHLIGKLAGVDAQLALLDEIARGAYDLATFSAHEVGLARNLAARYRGLRIGLADASIVVLAQRQADATCSRSTSGTSGCSPPNTRCALLPADG